MQNTWRQFINNNSRFHMAKALDMAENRAEIFYADDKFMCVLVESYCLMFGGVSEEKIVKLFQKLPNRVKYFNLDDSLVDFFKSFYQDRYVVYHRFLMKEPDTFDFEKLKSMIDVLPNNYKIKLIDKNTIEMMRNGEGYAAGISMIEGEPGFICLDGNNNIIGSVATDMRYQDGVELNVRVNDAERGKGIAKALMAAMIIYCVENGLTPVWDAANDVSMKMAQKFGYTIETEYDIYSLER